MAVRNEESSRWQKVGLKSSSNVIHEANYEVQREMQLFLIGYIIIEICEIFTVGWFPLDGGVRRAFTAVHIAAIVATLWILMLNGAVGYQLLDDGTPFSIGLILLSAAAIFIGVGYICLDTGFNWTGFWNSSTQGPLNRDYALYTLYQLIPLVMLFVFFVMESLLVLRILGERRPMRKCVQAMRRTLKLTKRAVYLVAAMLLFAIGQIFQYVISVHICTGTSGKINGGLFETLFTLLAVVMIWVFWSSITEDDWPMPVASESTYT
ncbi:MAG: hypothetical protein Q9165_000224 [Trypethelium subeluteriae]